MTADIDPPERQSRSAPDPYPAQAAIDEQRRAYVLDCIGAAASEMDAQALCQMVVDLAEMLRTGAAPSKARKLRPVP
ncbi:MAG TPA: hypothetical protein VEI03_19955 [Stellaceae bacterium]|nr:hypothetical protein [Stellaceae bacterium]